MGHEFEEISSRAIAAAIDVHRALGPGFIEPIYQKAVEIALAHRGIPFTRQKEVHLGIQRLDLVVADQVIMELKAIKAFEDVHFAQLRSYLKATARRVGLLINFNAPTLTIKRVVL